MNVALHGCAQKFVRLDSRAEIERAPQLSGDETISLYFCRKKSHRCFDTGRNPVKWVQQGNYFSPASEQCILPPISRSDFSSGPSSPHSGFRCLVFSHSDSSRGSVDSTMYMQARIWGTTQFAHDLEATVQKYYCLGFRKSNVYHLFE